MERDEYYVGGQASEEETDVELQAFNEDYREYEAQKATVLQQQRDETLQRIRDRRQRAINEIKGKRRQIRLSDTDQFWTLFFCRCCASHKHRSLYN